MNTELKEPTEYIEIENFSHSENVTKDDIQNKAVRLVFNQKSKIKLIYDFFNDSQIIATDLIKKNEVIEGSKCLKLITRDRKLTDTSLLLNCIALECDCEDCQKNGLTVILPTGHFMSYKQDEEKYNAVLELSGGMRDGTVFSMIKATADIPENKPVILKPTVNYMR